VLGRWYGDGREFGFWAGQSNIDPWEMLDAIEKQQAYVARYLRQAVDDTDEWPMPKFNRFFRHTDEIIRAENPSVTGRTEQEYT
jgi:hypothetical protein